MKLSYRTLFWLLFLFCSCKKIKPVVFSGQLLLTRKSPVPLSNRKIEIYQLGGNAIIMGSSGSSASAVTDANGRFSITFTPGSAYFAGITGENIGALTFASTEGFPFFVRGNFPGALYDENKPIFIGKSIDSLVIKVICFKRIVTNDTFQLTGTTTGARFEKKYTGITADSATTITLDTVYNALLTNFDCFQNTFRNTNMEFGPLKTYPGFNSPYFRGQSIPWLEFSTEDETKREMLFYYSNY